MQDQTTTSIGFVPSSPIGRTLNAQQRAFFERIPKVELHCHLLGTVRKDTFVHLARKHGAPISLDEIEGFYHRGTRPIGVLRVLRALEAHLLLTPEDFHRIAYEYLEDAAAGGIRHAEFFWNPTATTRDSGLTYAAAVSGILSGMREALADFDISSLLIPSIDREAPAADALAMVEQMIAHPDPLVAGIGIDYREPDGPPEMFAQAYALAKRHGLRTTAHAGEFGMPWTNVATVVDAIGVDRVDHGYTIVENPDLARDYAARGLLFTIVPTNSYYLRTLDADRWALDHPIRRMAELGLKMHPNTDDPTLHHVSPAGAWELMYTHLGFEIADLRAMMLNGIDGSWASEVQRTEWRTHWPAQFDKAAAETGILPA